MILLSVLCSVHASSKEEIGMKKLLGSAFKTSLCLMLAASCVGFSLLAGCGGKGNTVRTSVFTMTIADGWTITSQNNARVVLENGSAMLDVGFNQMGFPPPPENIPHLSYKFAGYSWEGFISVADGNLHVVKTKFTDNNAYCVIHTRGITPDDPVIVEMIESIKIIDKNATLPIM